MRILVTGYLGYIGWPLTMKLVSQGHEVMGVDDRSREQLVETIRCESAIPYKTDERIAFLQKLGYFKDNDRSLESDFSTTNILRYSNPDIIYHLAAQPSAPWSNMDSKSAIYTQQRNNASTLNILWKMHELEMKDTQLIFTSTMGEYGQPEIEIPWNSKIKIGNEERLFPRDPGSFYHLSKCFDTMNIMYAAKQWDLRCTILLQGVVYGTRTTETQTYKMPTRFDFDKYFGTVLNRFVSQAIIGHPLTVYGTGTQKRAFLDLQSCIDHLRLLVDPLPGIPSFFNDVTEIHELLALAMIVKDEALKFGLSVPINEMKNPRKEKEHHFYEINGMRQNVNTVKTRKVISEMFEDLIPYKTIIEKHKDQII